MKQSSMKQTHPFLYIWRRDPCFQILFFFLYQGVVSWCPIFTTNLPHQKRTPLQMLGKEFFGLVKQMKHTMSICTENSTTYLVSRNSNIR